MSKLTYTKDQVYNATLAYFNGNELATNVWMSKYALKDKDGTYLELTPADMHRRLAREFAKAEVNLGPSYDGPFAEDRSPYGKERSPLSEDKIYNLFSDFANIIPQGSIMAVLGDDNYIGSLSNCVVVPPPHDSYGGIMYTDQQLVQLMKRRCGVGTNLSTLRPGGTPVTNAAKTSTGATSFMERFSNTTREVAQAGRRGALMLTLDCRHPDILDFIKIKTDLTKVTGANISVLWTDDFMSAVEADTPFTLRWPVDATPETAQVTKIVRARDIWNTAIEAAHKSAEPGMIFMDRMRAYSTCHPYMPVTSTNPCSEIGMGNDTCRLIAINMFGSVRQPYQADSTFDYKHWYEVCYEATRLSDNLVELELAHIRRILEKVYADPEPEHIKTVEKVTWEALYNNGVAGRRIGLGFTALGDTLAALGFKYGTPGANEIVNLIMLTKFFAEWDATTDMAIERGPMPLWETNGHLETEFTKFLKSAHYDAYERMMKHGRRNLSLSTVAPTGSLSLLAKLKTQHGVTSGIEPLFAPWYIRRKKLHQGETATPDFVDESGDKWVNFPVYHGGLLEWATVNGIHNIEAEYANSPYSGACAPDLNWPARVRLQGLVQTYVTHSISSTVNLPSSATVADVDTIYRAAYKEGLKGITVYVDGSRSGVLVTKEEKIKKQDAPKRPAKLPCYIHNTSVRGDYWVVLVSLLGGEPYEIFAYPNGRVNYTEGVVIKRGNGVYDLEINGKVIQADIAANYVNDEQAALTRMISTALRHGTDVRFIVEQLDKAGGTVVDFSKAVARALRKLLNVELKTKETCPECGAELVFEDGCKSCKSCGLYSKCD